MNVTALTDLLAQEIVRRRTSSLVTALIAYLDGTEPSPGRAACALLGRIGD
jgi:hypothetical protein